MNVNCNELPQNLPANHDFVQCNFWHLHYVRKSLLDSHLANCEHRLEKEAFKITWECKLPTHLYVLIHVLTIQLFALVVAETTKFFQPKLLPVEDCGLGNTTEMLDSWESTPGPAFKSENMIAGAIHMT